MRGSHCWRLHKLCGWQLVRRTHFYWEDSFPQAGIPRTHTLVLCTPWREDHRVGPLCTHCPDQCPLRRRCRHDALSYFPDFQYRRQSPVGDTLPPRRILFGTNRIGKKQLRGGHLHHYCAFTRSSFRGMVESKEEREESPLPIIHNLQASSATIEICTTARAFCTIDSHDPFAVPRNLQRIH